MSPSVILPCLQTQFYPNGATMAKNASVSDVAASDEMVSDDVERMDAATFSDTELRGISSFEDAMRLAEEKFGSIVDASAEIGSGFVMLENKDKLIDEPFVILSVSFPEGDFQLEDGTLSHFAVVRLVTQRNDHYVITDGGHGIYTQLDEFAVRAGRTGGILVKGGLRKSEYTYVDESGKTAPAVTYYLNV